MYALGVMLSFSISQTGMFRLMGKIRHLKPGETLKTKVTTIHYEKNVNWKMLLNAIGAVVTFIVFIILVMTKFIEGAWAVALLIPIMVILFYATSRHYDRVSKALSTQNMTYEDITEVANVVVVPIADIHRGTILAIEYAKRISDDVRVLTIITSPEMEERMHRRWNRFPEITKDVQLILVDYDFRDIINPLVKYIENLNAEEFPHQITTVVVPEFIPEFRVANILHNQTANRLRARLREHKDIVIIDVPFHIDSKL